MREGAGAEDPAWELQETDETAWFVDVISEVVIALVHTGKPLALQSIWFTLTSKVHES